MTAAIRVEGVSKRFRLQHAKYSSLKERLVHFGRIPVTDFWALRDIELEVEQGTTVGLLGHNGSGKSTLLKCIAGILQPTTGQIVSVGRMAALLELGAGFHHELTGRENVYLNASILGMSRKETERRFDDIVHFAELEDFIDNQVKYYSSGMYVRLGFAVAVNMDPDILLVDEVLAVGDELFQRKCIERVRQFQREGRTIVVVTHAADIVRQVCDLAVVLERGNVISIASPGEAIRTFRDHLLHGGGLERHAEESEAASTSDSPAEQRNLRAEITSVTFEYPGARERPYLEPGERLDVRVQYTARELISDVKFGIAIHDVEGKLMFGTHTDLLGVPVGPLDGPGEFVWSIASLPLLDGTFFVTLAIHSHDEGTVYDWREGRDQFQVANPGRYVGLVNLDVAMKEISPARSAAS